MTEEKQREKIFRLLKDGAIRKVERGESAEALRLFKEAHTLASRCCKSGGFQETAKIWRGVAAYRLAHLHMRKGPNSRGDLERIEELLAEAVHVKALGPFPRIYRLALQHRLQSAKLMHFEAAVAAAKKYREEAIDDPEIKQARLQSGLHNLLELAAYFLGHPTDNLEGNRGVDDVLEGPWRLVSNDPVTSEVNYSEALAREELDARLEDNRGSLGFRLSKKVEWRFSAPQSEWSSQPLGPALTRFAASEMLGSSGEPGTAESQDTKRQNRRRLLDGMKQLAQCEVAGKIGARLPWRTDLLVFGAVDVDFVSN